MKKISFAVFGTLLFALILYACDSDEKTPASTKVQFWLTDAPGDFQEVNIDVESVEIQTSSGDDDAGWKTVNVVPHVYNLLSLTNGLDTLLGEIEIPEGQISQIRLKLGADNSIKVGDKILSLSTPSAEQSGLKLQVHQTFSAGITYKIVIDFDAARSIVATGNGKFKLKPVLRTITEAVDGAIKGHVTPVDATPAVFAIQGTDTLTTTYADSTGAFVLRGLAAGSYSVSFHPNSQYQEKTLENISVTLGQVTDVGEISISK